MAKCVIVNSSTCVTDNQCVLIAAACDSLLKKCAGDWMLASPSVTFRPKTVVTPTGNAKTPAVNGEWVFSMIDADETQPDALAYHTEMNDKVCGFVLCKTILDN